MKESQIIASVQPIHISSDISMCDSNWGKRSHMAFPFQSLIANGVRTIFGSDAPIESFNPFWGIFCSATRVRHDDPPESPSWYPEQKISLLQALQSYTIGPAFAAGLEDRLGRIHPNHLADMVILDKDPFSIPIEEVRDLTPVGTMTNGRWTYRIF
jgi:predicted amidohydrolase YtcJ